jgi:hypothetical protein
MFHNSWTSSNALSSETSSGQIKRIRLSAGPCIFLCQPQFRGEYHLRPILQAAF